MTEHLYDAEDDKRIEYSYGGKDFLLTKEPVHGFFTITYAKGHRTPKELEGHWTGVEEARKAIQAHVNKENHSKTTA